MYFILLSLLLLGGSVIATTSTQPKVTIKNGTVLGSSLDGVESFRGIPFAQPPVGQLRLQKPQSINSSFGIFNATKLPNSCPQFLGMPPNTTLLPPDVAGLLDSIFSSGATGPSSEDCLTINVQRPAGTNSNSKLPVLFWIYGGAFVYGSTQQYDGSSFINKSIELGEPIIYVAVNYRLNGFGFLPGKEVQKAGVTNLGLRDQRMGLEWVAENIAAFGGDPSKVTIWGESAGSASVFDQTIINSGDNTYRGKPLFRAAMMDSGATQPCNSVTSVKSQNTFDHVANVTGCQGEADVLNCLRELPYDKYLAAVTSVPGVFSYRSLDEAYLPKPDPLSKFFPLSPEEAVIQGKYARVPTIIGDQEDEGTLFSQSQGNISTTDQLVDYISSIFSPATRNQTAAFVATYPDNPSAGSPFGTGTANELYPQYKRLSAIQGDTLFTLQRRIYLSHVSATQPTWSYLASYFYGTAAIGTFHASDILLLYANDGPANVADTILKYYLSFVNYLDPNAAFGLAGTKNTPSSAGTATAAPIDHGLSVSIEVKRDNQPNSTSTGQLFWPQWNTVSRTLLYLQANSTGLTVDNFRQASYEYLKTYQSQFKFG